MKRCLSVMLAMLLVFAMTTAAFAAVSATVGADEPTDAVPAENGIYFDPSTSGWSDYTLIACHVWAINDDAFVPFDWGGKKQNCTQTEDGRWFYSFDEKGQTILPDREYCVIFYAKIGGSAAMQTYNLLFNADCIGHTASCDGTIYENPEDSNKTAQAAFWDDSIDPAVCGPELKISSIGTVIGTCCPSSTSPSAMFYGFLIDTLSNARTYSGKNDQTLIDDIGKGLGLTADDVSKALSETGVSTDWRYRDSVLEKVDPEAHFPEDPTDPEIPVGPIEDEYIFFDAKSVGWQDTEFIGFHIWEVGADNIFNWGSKKQRGSEIGDGVWEYDLTQKGITLDPEKQYGVIFYNSDYAQTYNLLFDTTCIGDTAYSVDGAVYENPVDSDRTTKVVYWHDQDPYVNGPQLTVSSIGTVEGICIPRDTTPFDLFYEFMIYYLPIARTYSGLTDQQLIENVAGDLHLTANDVEDGIRLSGADIDWTRSRSNLEYEGPVPGESTRERLTVDVAEGVGMASADKMYLSICYSLPPEYAYDTVTLTATPAEGYAFIDWKIEGDYDVDGDYPMESNVLPLKAYGSISAHAVFVYLGDDPIRGDYDDDGEITIMDATRAQRILAELDPRPEEGLLIEIDADRDGELTIMDATRIQRFLAELCDMDGDPPASDDTSASSNASATSTNTTVVRTG